MDKRGKSIQPGVILQPKASQQDFEGHFVADVGEGSLVEVKPERVAWAVRRRIEL